MLRTSATLFAFFALLTGSTPAAVGGFSANDGDQECTVLGELDWACLPASAGVTASSDGSGATDVVFSGSSKEEQPATWDLGPGGTNGKTDLLNVWAAGQETETQSFLQLAFQRLTGEGDVFLSFELNQTRVAWVNSMGDAIPCRTDGDVLISYAGSGVIVPVLYRWDGNGGPAQCPDGAHGSWVTAMGPAASAEGRTNGTAITNPLGGGSTLAAATFGEASLDLGSVARHVGLTRPCEYFTSVLAHSRTSSSISSSMSDFVTARNISLAACGGPSDPDGDTVAPHAPTLSADAGCHANGTVTLSGVAEAGSQVQVREDTTTRGLATAAADGTWSLQIANVATGNHVYTARAHDVAGNVSASSAAVSVAVDATPPVVAVTSSSATVGNAAISGTSDPDATITVSENGDTVLQTVADATGAWAVTFPATTGAHAYAVVASDACADSTDVIASVTVPAPQADPDADPDPSPTPDATPDPDGGTDPDDGSNGGADGGDPLPGADSGNGGAEGDDVAGGIGGPGGSGVTAGASEAAAEIHVLGETATCTGKVFKTFISDPAVKRVTFKVDGKTIAIVRKRDARKRFTAQINPNLYGDGVHRISAVLVKRDGKSRTVRMRSFRTCSLGTCISRRAFKIRVKRVSGDTVVRAIVYVNGKRVKVVRGAKRLRAAVKLTGLPRGSFLVKVKATTRKGRTVSDTRRYRTCAPKN